ncbi:MAG: hypothetical protein HXX12_09525 [Geothrix sp.]|uniref:hypothetical protein n=1 Tax=Geothrix sp. TaxID=1962974 RepID=UPI0017E5B798|nr:hypothetical protein [Geothrix sp.]NWJ41196.1 hypothetical protein [Geothrix sp.]WIL20813.1 MAG: hypothetical protein QOZ81_000044 [Geothrix sp.]
MRLVAFLCVTAALGVSAQETSPILASLRKLQAGDASARKDLHAGSPVRAAAMATGSAADEATRFEAASWLWQANLLGGFSYGSDRSYLQASRQQPDLLKAWSLLETLGAAKARERDALLLELGWRLLDLDRMRLAYERISTRSHMDIRELTHCFMVSMHLGDWGAAKAFGQELESRGANLAGFHQAAEHNLTTFDYESLLSAIRGQMPPIPAKPLAVASWGITKWRVRVKEVGGSHRDLVRMASGWPRTWTDKPDAMTQLLQVGAAAHWIEGAAQPPVSGFLSPDRLYMVGYRETKGGQDAGTQMQVWDMRPDPTQPHRWKGLNTLIARLASAPDNKPPAFIVTFDTEWDMQLVESFPETHPPVAPPGS